MMASSTSVTWDRRFSPTRAATMLSRRPRASWVSLRRAAPVSRRAAAVAAPGVEHVEGALATAERDHVAAEGADEVDVVGLQVPEDERLDAEAAEPDGHAADQARLAEARLARARTWTGWRSVRPERTN